MGFLSALPTGAKIASRPRARRRRQWCAGQLRLSAAVPQLLLVGVLAGACTATVVALTPQDEAAAESFVATTLAAQFPDYPEPEAAATCVRENATDQEVLLLAGTVGTGQPDPRRRLGVLIAQRPETQACFQSKNLPRLR